MKEIKLGGIKFPKRLIPKKNNPEADKIYTPTSLAERIISHFKPCGKCIDPCRGGGAFSDAMKRYGISSIVTCEIDEGVDFLTTDFLIKDSADMFDWSISNWPWSKFRAFLNKNMKIADNIVSLCPVGHMLAMKARIRDIRQHGFYIREIATCETPKSFPSSGFQLAACHISNQTGDCKFTEL